MALLPTNPWPLYTLRTYHRTDDLVYLILLTPTVVGYDGTHSRWSSTTLNFYVKAVLLPSRRYKMPRLQPDLMEENVLYNTIEFKATEHCTIVSPKTANSSTALKMYHQSLHPHMSLQLSRNRTDHQMSAVPSFSCLTDRLRCWLRRCFAQAYKNVS